MAMKICSIASGSSGNCIYIGSNNTNILIDVGISGKKVENGLKEIDISPHDLDGILVTHEHSDHVKGLGVMARRYNIPIYVTNNTWDEIYTSKKLGKIDENLFNLIEPNKDFIIKELTIHPFNSYHDAIDPVCYTIHKEDKKISVATDLGKYDDYIVDKLKDSNILFIEANHDINMLQVGKYPYFLKQRILSDIGHLSNEMSGKLITKLYNNKLSHIILGHLSKENNYPDLAYESVKLEMLASNLIDYNKVNLYVAKRDTNSELIII
jgi:phosphoribosyl 1,2-cyclic phosphodiesterase